MSDKEIIAFCIDLRNTLLAENSKGSAMAIATTSQIVNNEVLSTEQEIPSQKIVRKDIHITIISK